MSDNPPHRLGWAIRVGVYVMLLTSAFGAFFLDETLWEAARRGTLPLWAPMLPAVTFTAFVIIYAVDRWLLVQRRNFPLVRALFQIAAAVVFLSFLWPRQASEWRATREAPPPPTVMLRLLAHRDAEVRAAACELVGFRKETALASRVDELARTDGKPAVREACAQALERLQAAAAVIEK